MVLKVEDGDLEAVWIKRNKQMAKNSKDPRLLQPLDQKEMQGEGMRCFQLYASGLVKLPTSIANAKDFKSSGAAFSRYLDRHPYWQSFQAEIKGLVPYSLRDGYSWRGGKYYDRSMSV